jgi:hypothetical protein
METDEPLKPHKKSNLPYTIYLQISITFSLSCHILLIASYIITSVLDKHEARGRLVG